MVKQVTTDTLDDLDQSSGARTIRFGLDSISYEIDLNPDNEERLREFLQPFIDAARLDVPPVTTSYGKRAWLQSHGYDVGTRGRLSREHEEIYRRAFTKTPRGG